MARNSLDHKWRSFEKAIQWVHSQNIKNRKEWYALCKSKYFPEDIPKTPDHVYEKEWKGYGYWFGTGKKSTHERKHRPFLEARKFARTLNLKTGDQWTKYCKSGKKPDDISDTPSYVYKNKGWKGMPDFLGNRDYKDHLPFEESRKYAHSLNLETRTEWWNLSKLKKHPKNIPNAPESTFKNKGWKGWPDFLGSSRSRNYRPFIDAQRYAHSLNLISGKEWNDFVMSGKLPLDIPRSPKDGYKNKGWKSWADWLGHDYIASQLRTYLIFTEAKKFVHKLKLTGQSQWREYCKSGKKPKNVPAEPTRVYKKEWVTWGDWLGSGVISTHKLSENYLPFYEVKKLYQKYFHQFGLQKSTSPRDDWIVAFKKHDLRKKEPKLPMVPSGTYTIQRVKRRLKKTRDVSKLEPGIDYYYDVYDTFGIEDPNWSSNKLKGFLKSLLKDDYLLNEDSVVLFSLLDKKGLFDAHSKYSNLIKLIPSQSKNKEFSKYIKSVLESKRGDVIPETTRFETEDVVTDLKEEITESFEYPEHQRITAEDIITKPELTNPEEVLERAQKAYELRTNRKLMIEGEKALIDDTDAFRFYLRHYVNKLWHDCFYNEKTFIKQLATQHPKGKFAKEIHSVFFNEYDETKSLKIPKEYQFEDPTLMQKYFAYMVKHTKYYANFSGTGAGKTIASLLASRINKSKITLIICPNGVVTQWKEVIDAVFPNSKIVTKKNAFYAEESDDYQYLIINYDQFNQTYSKNNIQKLAQNKIDFIILDEIHFSKTSHEEHRSKRRKHVDMLLSLIRENNSKVKVTGLSATPVVNNLVEGRSMVELLSGQDWDAELKTELNVRNAMRLHEKFTIMSIREEPDYEIPIIAESKVVAKIPEDFPLRNLNKDNLAIEQFCTEARLPEIIKNIKGKTIVYTEFVGTGIPGKPSIIKILYDGITKAGFKCAIHTGDDHSGHYAFVHDKTVDVLIASKTISTGVDDLQTVCHNMIFNNIPWTHALYTQVIGRLIRKRQKNKVTIHHVLADVEYIDRVLPFDDRRMDAIVRKKTILDCAISGEYPEKHLVRKNDAIKALRDWIARLKEGKRLDLMRPYRIYDLKPDEVKRRERKFGDFATLNRKLISSTSENNFKTIQNNVELWYAYHSALNKNKKLWPFDPNDVWISKIEKLPKSRKIADFGCGEAIMGRMFGKNRVHSFDLHADDKELIKECNIRSVPLRAKSVDVAVYNLSLMGTDWPEILKEGKRVLKAGGLMFIADTKNHIGGYLKEIRNVLEELDFNIFRFDDKKEPFVMIEAIKDF